MPADAGRRRAGFTLIELLVVVSILAAIVALASLGMTRPEVEALRTEGERLAAVLRAAREEAIVRGRLLAVRLEEDGYGFFTLDETGRFAPYEPQVPAFAPHRLPPAVRIVQQRIEGLTLDSSGQSAAGGGIVFEPSGALPAFAIVLAAGEFRYRIWRTESGTIRAADDLEPLT
jgi:general secretion pathway protein H